MRADRRDPSGSGFPWALLLALALLPGTAAAQEGGDDTPSSASSERDTAAVADTGVDVTYRREVFTYPTGNRSDPFRPPEVGGMGPRFEDLALAGVIHAPEIGSVAILKDRSTGKRHRVRDGERLGSVRIVEIRRDEVVFSVPGVTGPRREVLQAKRQQEENP